MFSPFSAIRLRREGSLFSRGICRGTFVGHAGFDMGLALLLSTVFFDVSIAVFLGVVNLSD